VARAFLERVAERRILITYEELANALRISPPHSIHRVTEALERLMAGPGFFDCAQRLGRFAGDPYGQSAKTFHSAELNAVFACWGGSGDNNEDIMLTETTPTPNGRIGLSGSPPTPTV
jgi:hypothetical protein